MKNSFLYFYLFLMPVLLQAQTGTVYDNLTISSEILSTEKKYAIYLPAGYDTSERSYPVLYLLHGGGDDHKAWIQFGEVHAIADKAIREGKSTAMIIVMPDASGERRGYTNDPLGEWRYEDYFFEELMPTVEQKYRIRSEERYRSLAGLSMGGGGTFFYALHHPELFSSACPLSASGRSDRYTPQSFNESRREQNLPEVPVDSLTEWSKRYDVLGMIENMPEENVEAVRWYIDAGDDDIRASEGSGRVHVAMNKKGS